LILASFLEEVKIDDLIVIKQPFDFLNTKKGMVADSQIKTTIP
jgi:hypothetical protein